jgi:hypothetical protein
VGGVEGWKMIHNENHPPDDPHEFLAWLEAKRDRWENPPKWDLISRWTNHAMKRRKVLVDGTDQQRHRLAVMLGVRLLLACVTIVALSFTGEGGSHMAAIIVLGLLGGFWAVAPLGEANAYRDGYARGLLEDPTRIKDVFRDL